MGGELGVVLLKFIQGVSYQTFIEKLVKYGLYEQTVQWVENWPGPECGDPCHEV